MDGDELVQFCIKHCMQVGKLYCSAPDSMNGKWDSVKFTRFELIMNFTESSEQCTGTVETSAALSFSETGEEQNRKQVKYILFLFFLQLYAFILFNSCTLYFIINYYLFQFHALQWYKNVPCSFFFMSVLHQHCPVLTYSMYTDTFIDHYD